MNKNLFMRVYQAINLCFVVLFLWCITLSCKNKNRYTSPKGYNFEQPEKFKMPSSLLEVSGIAFNGGKSDTVYSVEDESGKLFSQAWGNKKQSNVKFAKSGDYEDLAIVNGKAIILKSNGHLYTFNLSEKSNKEADKVKEHKGLIPKEEYESIYADDNGSKVYIICKSCDLEKKKKQVTGYTLNYELDSFMVVDTFALNLEEIPKLNPKLKANLSPSAMTFNKLTNEWYILSSANKLLIIADRNWKIIAAHKLNSSTFNQPEGIAFDSDHNLFISNEGDEVTDGNILKFRYAAANGK